MISNAEYNGRWNWTNEYALYAFLDRLNVYDVKFGLSNIRRMGNKYNHVLDNWSKKYNIHECKNVVYQCPVEKVGIQLQKKFMFVTIKPSRKDCVCLSI